MTSPDGKNREPGAGSDVAGAAGAVAAEQVAASSSEAGERAGEATSRPAGRRGADTVSSLVWRSLAGMFGQLAAMSLFINLLSLAAPIFVIQVYDRVIPHSGYETLKGLFIAIMAVIAFEYIVKQARSRLVQMIALRVDVTLSRRLFDRLTGVSLRELEARPEGHWRTVQRDGDAIRDTVAGPAVLLLVDLPFALAFIGVIALVAPPLATVLLCLVPVYIALSVISARVIARSSETEHESTTERQSLTDEVVAGRSTVKALGLGQHLRERWEGAQARAIRGSVIRGSHVDGFAHMGGSLALLTTALMTTVGAVAITHQTMTIGALIAANMLASRVAQPLTQLISLMRGLERYRSSARRIDEILKLPIERSRSALSMPRPKGRLSLEKVTFHYPGETRPALENVTIAFAPGAVTGVVGANGSGKSTLLKMLQGLYTPESGRVLIDGADLSQFGRMDLSDWLGFVPQETYLFSGAIRDNIARGRPDIPDSAILRAAELAGAAEFIKEFPDGFGTKVGETGRQLSHGQRQRLSLARALVAGPAALLLDEPSAHLDFEAEERLAQTLQELKQDHSIVLVSHSRRLLESCDSIVVMHDGRIAMAGRASEMLPRQQPPAAPAPSQPLKEQVSA